MENNSFILQLLIDRSGSFVDFGLTQLDIKKKVKPKLGPNISLRLKFTPDERAIKGGKGYDPVSTTDDATSSIELSTINLN